MYRAELVSRLRVLPRGSHADLQDCRRRLFDNRVMLFRGCQTLVSIQRNLESCENPGERRGRIHFCVIKSCEYARPQSLDSPAECQKTSNRFTDRQKLGELNPTPADSVGRRSQAIPSSVMALEYSPVRHRSSIERVLAALQGNDPKLDSAVKVWTAFAVAKNFEITHSPLEDYIIRWLRAYPNSNFLEVLPEVSHQIADGLQNYDLARDSFAILVGEEALDNLRQARQPWVHKCCTFGRKKEELPEQIHTRVEYASKSFSERIKLDFAGLVDNGMQWIDDLPEVQKLSAYQQREMQETIHELKVLLKEYVRGAIYKTLCVNYGSVPGPDIHQEVSFEFGDSFA